MANPGETATWGTLEELLLACAVNRYGTKCWESVAGEIQKRSSSTTFHSLITPNTCRSKYNDLKRRFSALNTQPEASPPVNTSTAADDSSDTNQASLWLEELRRLRIAELKRDLERYDESILSLQLKVKRLKEEREHNQSDEKDEGLDLHRNRDKEKEENEKDKKEESRDEPAEIPSPSPESGPVKPFLGGEETQSVNVAGDGDACKPGVEIVKEMVEQVASPPDPTAATQKVVPTGENSYNGSSDSLATVVGTVKEVPDSRDREKGNDSVELVGSAGGGDEERKAAKESSDVQSSASLSRRKRKEEVDAGNNGGRSGGGGGEDEPDGTPAGGSVEKNSRPLIEFLDAVRSESVFVHRLKSQESPRYKNMIRQHIDLASIRAKVEGGQYSDDYSSFYHDLLLLTVNATTFFSKGSPEYKAAIKLRRVISRFSKSLTNSTSSSFDNILEAAATLKKESLKTSDRVAESRSSSSCSESQINLKSAKTNVGARSVMACRKRSSITTKKSDDRLVSAAGIKSLGSNEKGKGKGVEVAARKPGAGGSDQINKSSQFNSVMTKKRSRDQRFNSSSRSASNNTTSMAKTGHAGTGTTTSTNTKSSSVGIGNRGSAGNKDLEGKQEKKSSGGNNIEKNKKTGAGISNDSGKKNSLGSFLSKMKRSGDVHNNKEKESSSTLWESLKVGAMVKGKSSSTTTGGSRGGGGEQKKKVGGDKSGKSSEVGGSSSSNGPPPPTKVYSARKGMAAQQAVLREKKEKLIREKEKKKKRREVEEEEESDDDDDEEEISEEVSRRPPKRAAALAAVGKRRRASGGGGDGESTTAKKRSRNK